MVDSAYAPTRHFCDRELKRLGIETRYYDPLLSPEEIEALVTEKTRAIFMESPGSLTFEVQDVPGICAMARSRGIATLLDNTWATSIFFQAIAKGVDLSVVACTKYVAGHSDLMMGSVTAAPSALGSADTDQPRLRSICQSRTMPISPLAGYGPWASVFASMSSGR